MRIAEEKQTPMPLQCPVQVRNLSKTEFDDRDRVVMKCAYASQNRLGRLCDEHVYECDMVMRLRAEGFSETCSQVPLTVQHSSFAKTYYIDLLADDALYELKTVSGFIGSHDAQILNYAMLLGISQGKLLNFRTTRVEGRLRYMPLSYDERRRVQVDELEWTALSERCLELRQMTLDLISDWGAFLDCRLYNEALVHLFGGENLCASREPIYRDGMRLGDHRIQKHSGTMFFVVTAFSSDLSNERSHLSRLLSSTTCQGVQWINFNRSCLQLITLNRSLLE